MLNDYYQNIGMKGFIQRYGIVNAVKRGAFMFIKLHLVKDYEVRKVLWQERASTKIKPYLKYKDRHRSLFRSAMNLYVNILIKKSFC